MYKDVKVTLSKQIAKIDDITMKKYNRIRKLTIPKNIKVIDLGAFHNFKTLEKVYFEKESQVTKIPEGCFSGCTNLKQVVLPDSIISIGKNAFKNCVSIESITIPEHVLPENIDPTAFDGWSKNQTIYSKYELKKPITCKAKMIYYSEEMAEDFKPLSETDDISKYYIVRAKCGHVKRYQYMPIDFAIIAKSKKEAAEIIKRTPRVKKHHKDVILDIKQVSYELYKSQKEINDKDPYLKITSSREQKVIFDDIKDRLKAEENYKKRI